MDHDDEDAEPKIGGHPLSQILRQVRRMADYSQRELARSAGLSRGAVARYETGERVPSLPVLNRVLSAAGLRLVVVDAEGRIVQPLKVWREIADGAGRRFPAHLDTILDPKYGDWWADMYGLTAPPETFRRNRAVRDYLRERSKWEVRVAKYRHHPPPRRPPRAAWEP